MEKKKEGRTHSNKCQWQKDHRYSREKFNIIALIYGAAALAHAATREKLLAEVGDLLTRTLVAVRGLAEVVDGAVDLVTQSVHLIEVVDGFGGAGVAQRPQRLVPAGPEVRREGVAIGRGHGLDALVNDA